MTKAEILRQARNIVRHWEGELEDQETDKILKGRKFKDLLNEFDCSVGIVLWGLYTNEDLETVF